MCLLTSVFELTGSCLLQWYQLMLSEALANFYVASSTSVVEAMCIKQAHGLKRLVRATE